MNRKKLVRRSKLAAKLRHRHNLSRLNRLTVQTRILRYQVVNSLLLPDPLLSIPEFLETHGYSPMCDLFAYTKDPDEVCR